MKPTNYILFLAALAAACHEKPTDEANTEPPAEVKQIGVEVTAAGQTDAVSANPEDDAADDPAIWYNEADPTRSLILGSDKTLGLDVFDLAGKRLATYKVGRINNVDVRKDVLGGIDIVGGSHRDKKAIELWIINKDSLTLRNAGSIPTDLPDVYGFCLYKSPESGDVYAYINSKTGRTQQYKLAIETGEITGTMVRELKLPSQVEGMVADDALGNFFIGVEEGGIYHFNAEPGGSTEGRLLLNSGDDNANIAYDVEGLTIYYGEGEGGYLIASSQGNNTYAIFHRAAGNDYLGSFRIVDGDVCDGASETDGIDVIHNSLGSKYPTGMFICQDGYNYEGETKVAQNFKMVHWKDIAESFEPSLEISAK